MCVNLHILTCAGYFTSRPSLKAYVREMNNLLQGCSHAEALLAVVGGTPSDKYSRRTLRESEMAAVWEVGGPTVGAAS